MALARKAAPADYSRIRGTSPIYPISKDNSLVWAVRTSHARHWIMVSLSVLGSYGLPHRQNRPLKFCPYEFDVFSGSKFVCRVQDWVMAVVGQSQRKFRFGNSSICSWDVWHAMEHAKQFRSATRRAPVVCSITWTYTTSLWTRQAQVNCLSLCDSFRAKSRFFGRPTDLIGPRENEHLENWWGRL